MSNILISFFSPLQDEKKILTFYEGLIDSFKQSGNNVQYIITNNFLDTPWNGNNILKTNINKEKLLQSIDHFKPDLCIAFNNSIPECITNYLECPILLWHADTFTYFNDKEKLKKQNNRYYYACPFERDVTALKSAINLKEDNILNILPATAVQNDQTLVQSKTISFIGSLFQAWDAKNTLADIEELSTLLNIVKKVNEDPLVDYQNLIHEIGNQNIQKKISFQDCLAFSSVQNRNQILNNLTDLGLQIYGKGQYFNWLDTASILPYLAMCYNDRDVFSLKHNQDIYNTSKISINISTSQAKDGFAWRVFDIMASNSCLVSDTRNGLREFTKGYVDIPMYDDPYQAREICQKLLKDDVWRSEVIVGSQKCIEAKGRWHHRFAEIESAIGTKLINPDNSNGTIEQIQSRNYLENLPLPESEPVKLAQTKVAVVSAITNAFKSWLVKKTTTKI